MASFKHSLRLFRARIVGDHFRACLILKEIAMLDLSRLSSACDALIAQSSTDAAAVAAADSTTSQLQAEVDALAAKVEAAVRPAPVEAAPVANDTPAA